MRKRKASKKRGQRYAGLARLTLMNGLRLYLGQIGVPEEAYADLVRCESVQAAGQITDERVNELLRGFVYVNACRYCGKPITARRADAQFCSEAHKRLFHTENKASVEALVQDAKPITGTDKLAVTLIVDAKLVPSELGSAVMMNVPVPRSFRTGATIPWTPHEEGQQRPSRKKTT